MEVRLDSVSWSLFACVLKNSSRAPADAVLVAL
jgi:hypothetical protein